ncbi:MAG: hypothetical protein IJZ94_04145 [Clostridia bacterium]|nr:hypothetical protein [Clostridia bacterium]
MTDILLLGTYHFDGEKINFGLEEVQAQIDSFCRRMAGFSPDAVAVELDKAKYGDKVYISNDNWRCNISNEAFSVGGRIASFSGLEYICPVDKVLTLNSDMLSDESMKLVMPRMNFLKKLEEISDIRKKHLFINSAEYRLQDANMYLDINSMNRDGDYFESRCLADWYLRNLCIFSNIQKLSEEHDRILVLYGAGHVPILKDLIDASDRMNWIDPNLYL